MPVLCHQLVHMLQSLLGALPLCHGPPQGLVTSLGTPLSPWSWPTLGTCLWPALGTVSAWVPRWSWSHPELMCQRCVPAVTPPPPKMPPPCLHHHLSGATITSPLSPPSTCHHPVPSILSQASPLCPYHSLAVPPLSHRCPTVVPQRVPPPCPHCAPPRVPPPCPR